MSRVLALDWENLGMVRICFPLGRRWRLFFLQAASPDSPACLPEKPGRDNLLLFSVTQADGFRSTAGGGIGVVGLPTPTVNSHTRPPPIMITNQFIIRSLLLPTLLAGAASGADPKPNDEEAREELAKLAADKREALVVASAGPWSPGVYISQDGHALVDVQALVDRSRKLTLLGPGRNEVELEKILGVFPEEELALIKVDHEPKTWLTIAPEEPRIGELISLVPLNREDPWKAELRPLVGPVLVKRTGLTANLREMRFNRVMSLGSGMTAIHQQSLGPGCMAIDREGNLAGFLASTTTTVGQTLIQVAPVSGLRERIEELINRGEDLGHPLPAAHNPIDPAAFDPNWHPMNVAIGQEDWVEAKRLAMTILKHHPQSRFVQLQTRRVDFALHAENAQNPLLAFPEPDAAEPVTHQVAEWMNRGRILRARGELEAAVAAYGKAAALSPKDYPNSHLELGFTYVLGGQLEKGEKLYRECYPFYCDSLKFVQDFEGLLLLAGKTERAQKMNDRIWELEEIYKRPRW